MSFSPSALEQVVIKVSIGIGRNIEEAEAGLAMAKQRKHEGRLYNIEHYSGKPLAHEVETSNKTVQSYLRLEDKLSQMDDKEGRDDLENLKQDPKTGLLNKVGYMVEVAKLRKESKYDNRLIILIDGDNMKQANTLLGYEVTDEYLEVMGRALKRQIRSIETPFNNVRNTDILLNRKNDSGGDEFIIDISCDHAHAELVAKRYVEAMYLAQLELNRKRMQERYVQSSRQAAPSVK